MAGNINFTSLPTVLWQREISQKCIDYVFRRYGCLDHFAVNFILPNKEVINLCPNVGYIKSYTDLGMGKYENALAPWKLEGLPVVPWRLISPDQNELSYNKIVSFKERIHSLHSGMSFIHPVGDCYLNVAVASKCSNKKNMLTFFNNAEEILNIGAFILSLFEQRIGEFYDYKIPCIDEIILNDGHFKIIDDFSKGWSDTGVISLPPSKFFS
ncbi:hypothetical protein [Vibrio sp.]|uniref:hypothetical protein n=1 Tax=Vibrio sp. TaxID=678 RepID=UPI00311D9A26